MGYNRIPWDEIIPLLGKESDVSISKRFNVSKSSLFDKRLALGIKPYRSKDQYDWDEILPLIGKMPDLTIAKKFRIKSQVIGEKRKELNIAKYDPNKRIK